MGRYTVSTCHSLKLIPVDKILRFGWAQSRVIMILPGEPSDVKAVPGTIKVSATTENGKIRKKINFSISEVSDMTAGMLECYKASLLVAVYTDESGNRRVSGSPDYPLSLDYTTEGGVFNVTLEGEDLHPDGFLTD